MRGTILVVVMISLRNPQLAFNLQSDRRRFRCASRMAAKRLKRRP
jgi:hypothetical protein